jgi:RNA polymerase sigma factor (sigma-70 family)
MADARTEALRRLLDAADPSTREADWDRFVAGYSGLIIHVARKICGDHDGAMDHYAYVIEQLRADDFRRLRTFVADGRSELSTWLLVVAQRLCMDYHRHVYGRRRRNGAESGDVDEDLAARRRLVDMVGASVDLTALADDHGIDAEFSIRVGEMHKLLTNALETLAPRQRLLVKLRFEDGLSMPEIAKSLEMPSRFHAYRALDQVLGALKTALARNGVSDGSP